ncbi:hypothetical protein NEMBOFW57_000327 [Staphylotrichum longicolle]|uniref:protein S-acyltransferase n=1 Tax=Staphylotrichum longicolle TaxID=669026 RepID=A0AAD4HZR4_9PEZI|nr:hypothetical protein NEMBOFW57_000327 [Staphylotrichum longicolle]
MVKYSSKDFACLYVYFDYAEQRQQTYEKLLADLLCQLLRLRDHVTPEVEAVYDNLTANGIPPGPDEYLDMIKSEIKTFAQVFIVVDALDECLDEPPEHTAINFVRAMDQLPKRARILFTSRPMTTINDRIKADRKISVRTNINDLTAYFENRINNNESLKKLVEKGTQKNPRFFQNAVDTIIARSQGIFLLAQLHVASLASKRTLEDLELGIVELHTDLDAVYAKALGQIQHQAKWKRDLAIKVLNWLVYAERPLSLDELIHALGVNEADNELHRDRLLTEQDITLACAGIVLADPDRRTVSLTHHTAVEYLRNSGILQESQSYLATTCLVYICFDDFSAALHNLEERDDRLKQYPFLRYAVDYWGNHVARGVRDAVSQLAWNFLTNTKKLESAFQVMSGFPFRQESDVTGLHIAAYFGLTALVQEGFRNRGQLFAINAATRSGETALHWAARYRQTRFLQLLVDEDADLNLTDNIRSRNQSALHRAVANRDADSVKVLLESRRCELHRPDAHNWTPLRWAAAQGHGSLVKLLLSHGARVDDADTDGWTALRWAVRRDHMHVAKILISAGADVESPLGGDQDGRTFLQWVASEGRDPLVRLLVKRGVDVDAADERGWTALRWAVEYGRGTAARLLLQGGASLSKTDIHGFAPLHAAVQRWSPAGGGGAQLSLLRMLFEQQQQQQQQQHRSRTAGVNARTRNGFTPLHIAALHGYTPVVWLLLEKRADPTKQDSTGCTPLHCAAAGDHVDVSELLLASQRGGTRLARVVDNEMRTALHAAASGGSQAMVRVLLDGGALPIIDVRDYEGYTPLHLAVKKQYLDVVSCLVKGRANVNMVDDRGRTVLHSAMDDGNMGIIKALLAAENVDPTIKDAKGLTAWDVAKRRGLDMKVLERKVNDKETPTCMKAAQ